MKQLYRALLVLLTLCAAREGRCQGTWATDSSNGFSSVAEAGSCIFNGKIYIIGGAYDPGFDIFSQAVQIFNPVTHIWIQGPSLPISSTYPSCNALNGKIYAFVADSNSDGSATVEIFDSATNAWSAGPRMPIARYGQGSAVIGGKIYLIGGYKDSSVDVFDPVTETWSTAPHLPAPRSYFASCAVGGKIYVMGGFGIGEHNGLLDSVVIFDSATNAWSAGPSMPGALTDCSASFLDGKIYVMGGIDDSKTLDIFDTFTNIWSIGPNMLIARSDLVSDAINGKIYAIGGTDNTGAAVSVNVNEVFTPGPLGVAEGGAAPAGSALRVFPNPASGVLQIMGGQPGTAHLFDLMGREALTPSPLPMGEGSLDVSHLLPGTYFLRLGGQSAKVEIAR